MNINRKVVMYAVIVGMIVLISTSIFHLYTETLPSISRPVTTPIKEVAAAPAPNYAIPVNLLPTDNEIEENIKVQNEQQKVVRQAIADRMQKIATISEEIRMNQNEPTLDTDENKQGAAAQTANSTSSETKFKQIPKEILQNVQSRRYFVR